MTKHAYNNPTLNNVQFLFAVLHDPTVSLDHRMRAAECLVNMGYGDLSDERPPAVIYKIEDFRDAS